MSSTLEPLAPEASAAVVVVAHDGGPGLLDCIAALERHSPPGTELLVVDNASRDGSVEELRAAHPDAKVLEMDVNRGFAGGANAGLAFACRRRGRRAPALLALVNQDCVVSPRWLEPLARALADPRVGVVGARLLARDGVTLEHAGGVVAANGLTRHLGRGSSDAAAYHHQADVEYVTGALFVVRRDTWRRFGPFDEGYYPAYFEEVDFCLRLREAGLRVVYVPASSGLHGVAQASGGADSRVYLDRYHRSRMRFAARHLFVSGHRLRFLAAELRWLGSLLGSRDQLTAALRAYRRLPGELRQARRDRKEASR